MKILLVEDHPATRQAIAVLLEGFGHEVDSCPDAESAWAAYLEKGHEVVLLDLGLPDMDGIQFCRQIRAEPGGDRTGVLVVTGSDHPDDLHAALQAGADDYVVKPVDARLLEVRLAVTQQLIRSRDGRLKAEAELRRRFNDLSAVHSLTAAVSRALPLEEVYEEVLDALEQAFRTRRAAILLRDPDGELSFAAWHGLSETYRLRAAYSPRTVTDADHLGPLLVPSVDQEPDLAPIDEANHDEGIRAIAYLPLVYDERLLGEMVLYHGAPRTFGEEEVRLALTMATHVAFAIGRSQAEDALRLSEERFRQLAEHIDDIFWMSAAHRSEMVYVSPAYERICGRTRESLFRDPGSFLEAVHPDDLVVVERALSRLRDGDFPELECRILRPDGTLRWIRTRVFPIPDASGRHIVRFAGISEDATEEKLIADQLLQSEKLSATGMFVSGIAHELNNPLTAVLGFSELLTREQEGLSPKLHRWASQVHEQALRAKTIVEKLLTFSRQHKPALEPIAINDVVRRTLSTIEDDCRCQDVEVHAALGDVPLVLADEQQMRQVLLHLFSNAVQAMASGHGGGHLLVTTQSAGPDRVEIRVADDGPGIAPDESRRVFDPFYTTREVGEGVGLGLSTAFAIVKEHGGEIQVVETEPPPGATFKVILPVAPPPATAP